MRRSHYVGWWSDQSGTGFAPSARRSIAAISASPSVHRVHLRSPPMPMFPVSELTARMANGPVAIADIVQNVALTDRFRAYKKHICPPSWHTLSLLHVHPDSKKSEPCEPCWLWRSLVFHNNNPFDYTSAEKLARPHFRYYRGNASCPFLSTSGKRP